jgi:hypothetical protein
VTSLTPNVAAPLSPTTPTGFKVTIEGAEGSPTGRPVSPPKSPTGEPASGGGWLEWITGGF